MWKIKKPLQRGFFMDALEVVTATISGNFTFLMRMDFLCNLILLKFFNAEKNALTFFLSNKIISPSNCNKVIGNVDSKIRGIEKCDHSRKYRLRRCVLLIRSDLK